MECRWAAPFANDDVAVTQPGSVPSLEAQALQESDISDERLCCGHFVLDPFAHIDSFVIRLMGLGGVS